jgi:hypothetical protein
MELVLLSEKYKLTHLKTSCLKYISQNISKNTVVNLLNNAMKNHHSIYSDVEKRCLQFISENAGEVFLMDGFNNLDEKIILSLLNKPVIG